MTDVGPSQDPTGEPLPGLEDLDAAELQLLHEERIGEGDLDDPHLPADFDWEAMA